MFNLIAGCDQGKSELSPAPSTDVPPNETAIPVEATPVPPTDTPPPPTPTIPQTESTTVTATEQLTYTATLAPTGTPIAESAYDGVRVNIINNAGFLVTVGDKRILIDAIYAGFPGGILKPLLDSQPPFDGVDLILATHEHADHFDPQLVLHYLEKNPESVFVSTPNAVEAIAEIDSRVDARLIAIDLARGDKLDLSVAGIDLQAIHLSHGIPGLLNLGYLITIDGVTLFHTGDIDPDVVGVEDLMGYGLPGKAIDVAFVPDFLAVEQEYIAHIHEGIQPRHLIPMHFPLCNPPAGIVDTFQSVHIFSSEYESWIMP
jgi:L-ascorbate metabolism protein UlaG (beta-lactamase superfamily)